MKFAHRVLLKWDPERAHHSAIRFLKFQQKWHFGTLRKRLEPSRTPALVMKSPSPLRFSSRVGLAAGFDKNAEVFAEMGRRGFGFVEVGTVTPKAQPGNPKPRIWRYPEHQALVNALGFNNRGGETFKRNVLKYKEFVSGVPVFANIGKGINTPLEEAREDYVYLLRLLESVVDGFVINVSSPNTQGLRELQSEQFLERLASELPRHLPVWIKVAPDLDNESISALANFVNKHDRYSGMVLTNTSIGLAKSLGGREKGGLSGAPLVDRAVECVSLARQAIQRPKLVIGVGGISNSIGAKRFFNEGADLIEIYTAFIYQGFSLVKELNSI